MPVPSAPPPKPLGGARAMLSPKQVALAAGVSESTIKRLVDDGSLKAERTAGGHRRIRLGDALRWVRSRGCGQLDPAALSAAVPALEGAAGVDLCDRTAVLHRYAQALEAGEDAVTTGLAVALFVAGAELSVVLEEPIRGRYAALRSRCDHPSRECVVLHRALANSIAAAGRLRDLIRDGADTATLPADAPTMALADVGYEVDSLPVHLAATVAAAAGYDVTNLGPSVPAEVLGGTADRVRPDLLWVSAGGAGRADAAAVAEALAEAARACEATGGTLLVHGDALPADAPGERVNSLSALARRLAG
ncbi:excisionase family DNA-binding protein [Alienimonas sp. DA493]|uniref:excisionase family DNA-binding protein n=1 Tax=Alienimonas sp. DA493 TaxID=3373605 RepID=UPI00375507C3